MKKSWFGTRTAREGFIEWDGQVLRAAVLQRRRGRRRVLAAGVTQPQDQWADEATHLLRLLAGDQTLGSLTIVLGRRLVAMHEVTVPRVPPEELPGLVRFQAIRDLALPPERAHLDFCVTSTTDNGEGGVTALVATVEEELWDACASLASRLDVELKHVLVRPIVSAELATAVAADLVGEDAALFVQPVAGTYELVLLRAGRPVLVRGVSVPSGADRTALLERELRRTQVVGAQRFELPQTYVVVLPGPVPEAEEIEHAARAAGLRLFSFDPTARLGCEPQVQETIAGEVGYWTALAAVAAGPRGDSWSLDLARPKLPSESRRLPPRPVLVVLCTLAAGAAVLAAWSYRNARTLDQEIELYRTEERQLDRFLQAAAPLSKKHRVVSQWIDGKQGNTTLLHLLQQLSAEFPDTQELYLQSLRLRRTEEGQITMVVEGYAKSPQAVARFHARLNQGQVFRARPRGGVEQLPRRTEYAWHFESELTLVSDEHRGTPTRRQNRTAKR